MLIKPFNGSPANYYFVSSFRVLAADEIIFSTTLSTTLWKIRRKLKV